MKGKFVVALVALAACRQGPPLAQLPLAAVASNIEDVRFELRLPEGATETGQRVWERTSASQRVSVRVQVGAPVRIETMKSSSALRSSELADGYALTTPTTSQRAIALDRRGVYCTASLNVAEGKPTAEQLAYLDSICGSLKVLTN